MIVATCSNIFQLTCIQSSKLKTMFIFVAYKDAPELSTVRRRSNLSEPEEDQSVEKTLLVNPICPIRVMLEYIRKNCRLGIYTCFDLCDEEGTLKGLFNLPTFAYATDAFEHRKTYYLIVFKMEADRRLSLIPQLNHENRLFLILKERCKIMISTPEAHSTPPISIEPGPTVTKTPKKK